VKAFYDAVRRYFGPLSQGQVDGFEAILAASSGHPQRRRAYMLATAWHETARSMQPVKETVMPHHKDKNPSDAEVIRRLDAAYAKGALGQVSSPYWRDGWFGRGYVQLTHKRNYERVSQALGVDLVANPSLALRPDIAARVLVQGCAEGWFTGKKLGDYTAYYDMRLVVNGTDKAAEIKDYAVTFEGCLVATTIDQPAFNSSVDAVLAPSGWAKFIAALLRLFNPR